jgi:stage III sporulation protein AG
VTILERKLENILSQIKGAGEVNVMITLQNTTEKVPAVNTTKNQENTSEKDSQGGVRETLKEDTVYEIVTKENEDSFITLKEINPEVNGVIVVAQGADDAVVKEKLYEAVKTVLGISGSKVDVYSSN